MFESIAGNALAKETLQRLLRRGFSHSLLFAGPDGIGKSLFAKELALALQKETDPQKFDSHPDFHDFKPEGKTGMHSALEMRRLSQEVYMAPFKGPWKVFIIHDAERMLPVSSNALLKTFEEPPPDCKIILLSSSPSSLLPTILSRCQTISFQVIPEEEMGNLLKDRWNISFSEALKLAKIAQGSLGKAIRLKEQGGEAAKEMLLHLLASGKMEDYKAFKEKINVIYEKLDESKKQMEEALRQEFFKGDLDNLTAVQKENLEKEVSGALTLRQHNLAFSLFEAIFGWYRDLELLSVNGNPEYLVHRDFKETLFQSLQRGETHSCDYIAKIIKDAKLSLERSTAFPLVLENLLLKII
jgi:DNA polymerase-3 subunit delta'